MPRLCPYRIRACCGQAVPQEVRPPPGFGDYAHGSRLTASPPPPGKGPSKAAAAAAAVAAAPHCYLCWPHSYCRPNPTPTAPHPWRNCNPRSDSDAGPSGSGRGAGGKGAGGKGSGGKGGLKGEAAAAGAGDAKAGGGKVKGGVKVKGAAGGAAGAAGGLGPMDVDIKPPLPGGKSGSHQQQHRPHKPVVPFLDYRQYYPTVLPLRPPGEEVLDDALDVEEVAEQLTRRDLATLPVSGACPPPRSPACLAWLGGLLASLLACGVAPSPGCGCEPRARIAASARRLHA